MICRALRERKRGSDSHCYGGQFGHRGSQAAKDRWAILGQAWRRDYATERQSAAIRTTMNYRERIVRDPRVVGGEPVLKGTRVTLRTVLASLAEGATTAEILADFPTLSEEDLRTAIAFAAMSAQEDLPLDENLPERLVSELGALGHDVDTVRAEHLAGQADNEI
jgi:uncharacterized protein (DUF433 family)